MTAAAPASACIFDAAARRHLIGMLTTARRSIMTAQFAASPIVTTTPAAYRQLMDAAHAAARRGVVCSMVLAQAGPRNPQSSASLLAASQLIAAGWRVRWAPAGRLMHAKMWVFDASHVVIGSHNLTESAMSANHEASLIATDAASAADAAQWFGLLWAKSAPALTKAAA